MTKSEKKQMLKWNSILWVVAMVLPGIFQVAFASTKFPWPVIIPFLLFGFLLASNSMLAKAIGEPTDDPTRQ
jgi:fatty acid desaturase